MLGTRKREVDESEIWGSSSVNQVDIECEDLSQFGGGKCAASYNTKVLVDLGEQAYISAFTATDKLLYVASSTFGESKEGHPLFERGTGNIMTAKFNAYSTKDGSLVHRLLPPNPYRDTKGDPASKRDAASGQGLRYDVPYGVLLSPDGSQMFTAQRFRGQQSEEDEREGDLHRIQKWESGTSPRATAECYTQPGGADYRGNISLTHDGRRCLPWSNHTKSGGKPDIWAGSRGAAAVGLGNHNSCRNPKRPQSVGKETPEFEPTPQSPDLAAAIRASQTTSEGCRRMHPALVNATRYNCTAGVAYRMANDVHDYLLDLTHSDNRKAEVVTTLSGCKRLCQFTMQIRCMGFTFVEGDGAGSATDLSEDTRQGKCFLTSWHSQTKDPRDTHKPQVYPHVGEWIKPGKCEKTDRVDLGKQSSQESCRAACIQAKGSACKVYGLQRGESSAQNPTLGCYWSSKGCGHSSKESSEPGGDYDTYDAYAVQSNTPVEKKEGACAPGAWVTTHAECEQAGLASGMPIASARNHDTRGRNAWKTYGENVAVPDFDGKVVPIKRADWPTGCIYTQGRHGYRYLFFNSAGTKSFTRGDPDPMGREDDKFKGMTSLCRNPSLSRLEPQPGAMFCDKAGDTKAATFKTVGPGACVPKAPQETTSVVLHGGDDTLCRERCSLMDGCLGYDYTHNSSRNDLPYAYFFADSKLGRELGAMLVDGKDKRCPDASVPVRAEECAHAAKAAAIMQGEWSQYMYDTRTGGPEFEHTDSGDRVPGCLVDKGHYGFYVNFNTRKDSGRLRGNPVCRLRSGFKLCQLHLKTNNTSAGDGPGKATLVVKAGSGGTETTCYAKTSRPAPGGRCFGGDGNGGDGSSTCNLDAATTFPEHHTFLTSVHAKLSLGMRGDDDVRPHFKATGCDFCCATGNVEFRRHPGPWCYTDGMFCNGDSCAREYWRTPTWSPCLVGESQQSCADNEPMPHVPVDIRSLAYNPKPNQVESLRLLDMSRDGGFLVAAWRYKETTGNYHEMVRVLRTEDLALETEIRHKDGLGAAVLSADTQLLFTASANRDMTIVVWHVATGKELRSMKGHAGPVNTLNLSPDGRFLFSGSDDRSVRMWDAGANPKQNEPTPFALIHTWGDPQPTGSCPVFGSSTCCPRNDRNDPSNTCCRDPDHNGKRLPSWMLAEKGAVKLMCPKKPRWGTFTPHRDPCVPVLFASSEHNTRWRPPLS